MSHDINSIRNILKSQCSNLLTKQNVIATGVGYKVVNGQRTDTLCITCSVREKKPVSALRTTDMVAQDIDGIPTDVVETGVIRALRTSRYRPAPGGVSIGHRDITAGTLGCLVKKDGETFILSNNHVLANSNNATKGDPILQPGPHDGGTLANDVIAHLESFVPIGFGDSGGGGGGGGGGSNCPIANSVASLINMVPAAIGSNARLQAVTTRATENRVDAAIAKPINLADVSADILDIGTLTGTIEGELGMAIKKSGRTTQFTTGVIEQIDVTVDVSYGGSNVARFVNQFMAGAMS